jgi:hypothetical protein
VTKVAFLALAFAVGGCASGPAPAGDTCQFAQVQQAFTSKCLTHSLDPVTDPQSPDFGRVPCWMVELGAQGSDFCQCESAGYRPVSEAELETALATLRAQGECRNACCDSLCFCELLQLSGDQLRACQAGENESIAIDTPGFCYVEPAAGVGDPSTVAACAKDEQQQLILTPLRATRRVILSCETTLE